MSEEQNQIEEKAKSMGWVPKSDFKGDPDQWRDAKAFVERGENMIPILKSRLDKTEQELRIALQMNKAELDEIKKSSYEKAKAEFEEKLRALDEKEFEAFQSGDAEAYKKTKAERQKLKPPAPPKQAEPQQARPDPVFEDWQSKNAWYQEDADLRDYADFIGHKIASENMTNGMLQIPVQDLYEKVSLQVKKQFPNKFQNPNREGAAAVEGSKPAAQKTSKHTFEAMPDSARAQYKHFNKRLEEQGRKPVSKEQYAKYYWEQF